MTEALQALYISNPQYKDSTIESLGSLIETESIALEILELLGEESESKREEIRKFFVLNDSAYRSLVKLTIDNSSSSMVSGIKIINWISNSQYIGKVDKTNLEEAMKSLALALDIKGEKEEEILVLALQGLEAILKWGNTNLLKNGVNELMTKFEKFDDSIRKVEQLQTHMSEKVYEAAVGLLESVFSIEEEM